MAPLSRTEVLDRMRQVDHMLAIIGNEIGDCASARTKASAERTKALADAYMVATGNSTDRRQAALAVVGNMGMAEDAAYAKVLADHELHRDRQMGLAAMLKACRAEDEEQRYADGP